VEEEAAGSFEKVLEAGVCEWLWRRRQPRDSEGDATMGGLYLTTSL